MISIIEVGPRDGLQNEPTTIPTQVKIDFVDALSASGVQEIEVSAFVSPASVAQLADAEDVFSAIQKRPGITYSALVPNEQGMERALAAGVEKISVFTAASETFNQKNINASIDESFERFKPVVKRARREGIAVRGYVSTAFGCPYEGSVSASQAAEVIERLCVLGVDEVSIGDTMGVAQPEMVHALLDRVLGFASVDLLALHFHDTFGRGVENALVGWSRWVRRFDSSAGGLGGCPYAPGAPGNLATETLIQALRDHGAEVSADLGELAKARAIVAPYLS